MNLFEFEKFIETSKTDYICAIFTAPYCKACTIVKSYINDVEGHIDNIKFQYIDIVKSPEMAREYSVNKLPTIYIFEKGSMTPIYHPIEGANLLKLQDKIDLLGVGFFNDGFF